MEKKNLPASIRARLLNKAKERNEDFQNILIRFANERLLYRISVSPHKDAFFLKGAALFSIWFNEPHRSTKDIDLLSFGEIDLAKMEAIFREISAIGSEDGIEFDTDSVSSSEIREDQAYKGIRITLNATLDGAKINLQIDIGFGDAVTPKAQRREIATILPLPKPELRIYPKETVVAEKFEAMVKLGLANSRMKDFWDLQYLIEEFEFEGEILQQALRRTFENRSTNFPKEIPMALTEKFVSDRDAAKNWQAFIKRNSIKRASDFSETIKNLANFFEPLIAAQNRKIIFAKFWKPVVGWR